MYVLENKAVKEIFDLLRKYGMSPTALAINIQIVPPRLSEVLKNKRRISPNTDLRLCRFFKKENGHFLRLQIDYDLETALMKAEGAIEEIKTVDEVPASRKF